MNRAGYVVVNVAKNCAARVVLPVIRGRGELGIDGNAELAVGALNRLAPGLGRAGVTLPGATVVELGSGRTPELCAAMLLVGAERATGFDLHVQTPDDAASAARYGRFIERLVEDGEPFLSAVKAPASAVRERRAALGPGPWPLAFERYGGTEIPLADESVDLIFSRSVLEHVDRRGVAALIGEMARVLRPGGTVVHLIDLRDHLRINGDEEVHGDWLEALQFSDRLYRAMFSQRRTYINRLREPDWREAFVATGFELCEWTPRLFPLASRFDRGRLQPEWRVLDDDILAIGALSVAARKP